MTTMACMLSGLPIAEGDDAVLVIVVADDKGDTDGGAAPTWVPVGYPVRGRHDGRGWVAPTGDDAVDARTLKWVVDRMLFRGNTLRSIDPENWHEVGTVVLDGCATLYSHATPTGKVSGTLAAAVARPDALDALIQAWMALGAKSTSLRDAVLRYVVPLAGTPTPDETERHETARRATYDSLGLGRETLRIADEAMTDGVDVPVPEVFRRAYEAMSLPCAMESVSLAYAPGVRWHPPARLKGYEYAVADRFRAALDGIAAGPDGPAPEPVDLDWRPADPEGPYVLFLDDLRFPAELRLRSDVAVARSSDEAIAVATRLGMPAHVDFDHDLGGDDTAMRFVRWVVDQAVDHGAYVGDMTWAVHSSNPVGRDNIDGLMRNIVRHSREASRPPGP